MKQILLTAIIGMAMLHSIAQSKVTGILTSDTWSTGGTTYAANGMTYQWAQNPNNVTRKVVGFSTSTANFDYDNTVQGSIKLKRKNNPYISGQYNLIFAEGYQAGSLSSMSTPMPSVMDDYLDGNIYNKGAENLFDNTGTNKNNVERLDWLANTPIVGLDNDKLGFVIIQKGNEGDYMPVNIAAITAVDANGEPTAYGPVKSISETEWENIFNSSFSNRINKAVAGNQLLAAGGGVHSRAGIYVKFSELGIGANVPVYGYSLFAADLPINTPALTLANIADNSHFPVSSCCYCGFDFVAVTGLFKESNTLPLAIHNFSGRKLDGNANQITVTTNNYFNELEKLELLKSSDGVTFNICASFTPSQRNSYTHTDVKLTNLKTYYRIKLVKKNSGIIISHILKVDNDRNVKSFELVTNPVRTNLSFAYRTKEKVQLQAMIVDMFGKIISTNAVTAQPGANLITVNATNTLANGIYILQVSKNGVHEKSIRFMKQ